MKVKKSIRGCCRSRMERGSGKCGTVEPRVRIPDALRSIRCYGADSVRRAMLSISRAAMRAATSSRWSVCDRGDRLQGSGVAGFEIVEGKAGALDCGAAFVEHGGDERAAGICSRNLRARGGAWARHGVLGRQIGVAGREREAILLPHVATPTIWSEIEVSRNAVTT